MPSIRHRRSWLFPLALLLVTFLAYWPVTRAGFIWDDDAYVQENPVYTAQDPLWQIWFRPESTPQYYPIVFTSFYFERRAWGLNPLGFHLMNVLLHAGSAILLWKTLRHLKVPGASLAAAVFALHPMMVESVAWVTERKNTFSTFFFLASLLAFLHFLGRRRSVAQAGLAPLAASRNWWWYGVSLVLFVLAMLSKSVACGLAPVLVLILWWKRSDWRSYLATLPCFAIGMCGGLFTAYMEVTHVGAQGNEFQLSIVQKILLAGEAIWFYVFKLLWPVHLSFYYTRWPIDPSDLWQWQFPAAVIIALGLLWLSRDRLGRAPLVAALAFITLLFPALGFFALFPMMFSWVADHFAYLATLAFIPAVCAPIALAARLLLPGKAALRAILALPLLVVLGAKTFWTTYNYESMLALWSSVQAYDPLHPHWNALSGLSREYHSQAVELKTQGRFKEALEKAEQARSCAEQALQVRPGYAIAYNNLAGYYSFIGEYGKALPYVLKAVELEPYERRFYVTLGDIYDQLGQNANAIGAFATAVKMSPNTPEYRVKLARAYVKGGRVDLAEQCIHSALALDNGDADAHLLLGSLLAQSGQMPQALAECQMALDADPRNLDAMDGYAKIVAHFSAASVVNLQKGLELAQSAVAQTNGTNPVYLDTLGMMLARTGHLNDAAGMFQRAIDLTPASDAAARDAIQRHLATVRQAGAASVNRTPATASDHP